MKRQIVSTMYNNQYDQPEHYHILVAEVLFSDQIVTI